MKYKYLIPLLLTASIAVSGCSTINGSSADSTAQSAASTNDRSDILPIETTDLFTDRDLEVGYDEETSISITLTGSSASCNSDSVNISDNTITITEEGTYILSGTLNDGMIIIDAKDTDKIQLVLSNATIHHADSAAIYVLQADKVFITTAAGTTNTLTNGGTYTAIDDNNIDAVIYSKDDLTLNGEGTLNIQAAEGHGIVSKDDLTITSGTYEISAAKHGLSGKDSVRIAGGTYTMSTGEDGIHASNSDDSTLGFIYISDGNLEINAGDDGIHADSALIIEGGNIAIKDSYEGLEGLSIDITGGNIDIYASDDGLNAAAASTETNTDSMGKEQKDIFAVDEGAYIHISGGTIHINAAGDGVDSNGDFTVSGGETYISGPVDGANGAIDYNGEGIITGGTILAVGSSAMAQSFGNSSTQGVITVALSANAGSTISLSDEKGTELISWQTEKDYSSITISCPEITEGSTYTLTAGDQTSEITMDSLIYGSHAERGGNPGNGQMPSSGHAPKNGQAPDHRQKPNGDQMPGGDQIPDGGQMPSSPSDKDYEAGSDTTL